jgi:hypothetical protein
LRVTAQQPCACRNGKRGATCQQAEWRAAASKPALKPVSTSTMPAWH